MRTNRLISRQSIDELELPARIQLEAKITDEKGDRIPLRPIPPNWTFSDFTNDSPWRRFTFDFLGSLKGKTILDLGCGYFPTPVYFAKAGAAQVYATDVSPRALRFVREMAERENLSERVETVLCPAESLPFGRETFDLVHGEAILHHVDLRLAAGEIARVLKTAGRAAFKDPLGQNPLLEFARDYLPYRGKDLAKGTDRPLSFDDCRRFGKVFPRSDFRAFGLLSMAAVPFVGRRNSGFVRQLHRIDNRLLVFLPGLQRLCRFVVITVSK